MAVLLAMVVSYNCSTLKEDDSIHHEAKGKVTSTAKESSESWTEWAKDKISEGLGIAHGDAKDTANKAHDAAYGWCYSCATKCYLLSKSFAE